MCKKSANVYNLHLQELFNMDIKQVDYLETLKIRVMNISDYRDIYNLWIGSGEVSTRNIDDSRDGIERLLQRNPDINFVAEINDKIVGTILCGYDGRKAYIYHLFVEEAFRRKNIGKVLVSNVINALKSDGVTKVALVVFKDNKRSNSFWKSLEFEKRDDLIYRDISLNIINI